MDVERQVRIRSLESLVILKIFLSRRVDQIPLIARNVLIHVHRSVRRKSDVQLETVISPGAELHVTALDVEGKVSNVDATRGLVDGRWNPEYTSIVRDDGHHIALFFQSFIGTTTQHMIHVYVIVRLSYRSAVV